MSAPSAVHPLRRLLATCIDLLLLLTATLALLMVLGTQRTDFRFPLEMSTLLEFTALMIFVATFVLAAYFAHLMKRYQSTVGSFLLGFFISTAPANATTTTPQLASNSFFRFFARNLLKFLTLFLLAMVVATPLAWGLPTSIDPTTHSWILAVYSTFQTVWPVQLAMLLVVLAGIYVALHKSWLFPHERWTRTRTYTPAQVPQLGAAVPDFYPVFGTCNASQFSLSIHTNVLLQSSQQSLPAESLAPDPTTSHLSTEPSLDLPTNNTPSITHNA